MKTTLAVLLVLFTAETLVVIQQHKEIKEQLVIYQKELYSLHAVNKEISTKRAFFPYIVSAPAKNVLIFACRPIQLTHVLHGQKFYLYYIVKRGSKLPLATREAYNLIFKIWNYLQIGVKGVFIACHVSPPQLFATNFSLQEFLRRGG